MGIREGRFCDLRGWLDKPCEHLALGTCVLCERDVCHETHSYLRDKFVPSDSQPSVVERGHALTLSFLIIRTEGNTPIQPLGQPTRTSAIVCTECGPFLTQLGFREGLEAAMKIVIADLRAKLTVKALSKKDAKSD